jgi:TonB-dependent starch-binding outer membrane protein SusC
MFKSIYNLLAGFVLIACVMPSNNANAQTKSNKQVPLGDTVINIEPPEFVSNGYMMIRKNSIPGSISIVKENRIKELAGVSVDALLQAQAAGVRLVNTSGAPGSGALTFIRGVNTINAGCTPLYIVDGIPVKANRLPYSLSRNVDNNPLADISPQDIASISVLKDGHATALYGMRGADGVIIINTYGGTSGKTYLDVSANMGIMQFPEPYSVLDADQYRAYILEKEQARPGITQTDINNGIGKYLLISTPADQVERYNNNTNWQKDAIRTGMYNDFHLVLRGGDAVAKYALNVGYTDITGAIKNTGFERFTTRFNLDYKVGKKLSFLNTLSYTRTDKQMQEEGSSFNTNPVVLNSVKSPVLTAFQQNNLGENVRDLDSADFAGRNNPYSVLNRMTNKNSSNRILGRVTGQYTFSPFLNLRIAVAGDYYRIDESRFQPSEGFAAHAQAVRSSSVAKSYELMLMNENTLNFNKSFSAGRHVINATIGAAYQSTAQEAKTAEYINAPSDLFSGISSIGNSGGSNPQTDPNIDTVMSYSPSWKLLSFFATTQYTFKDKYILGANFRADGSGRFAEGHRFGYFPSVAGAWRISKESFLQTSKTITDLKLRASFGISGNQEVGYYNAFNALVSSPYNRFSGIRIGILGNSAFQWEETKQSDLGIDAEFFGGRLGLIADVYIKETDHLYNTIKLPGISGFNSYAVSEGSVRNKGVELTVYGKIFNGAFGWETSFNAAYNKNEILSLPDRLVTNNNYGDFASILQTGSATGVFYGYNALGVYSNSGDVNVKNGADNLNPFKGGDIIFEDVNKDGIIDEKDAKIIGNVNPDWFGGFYNVFSFKGFDLSAFIDFALGNEVYNAHRALLESMYNYDNQSTSVNAHWRNEGDVTDMPRLLHGDPVGNTRFSSRWIEDGAYARVKAITLGYNFPLKGLLKNTLKNARISISAQNLYTFSNYKGYSPEVASVTTPLMYGVDYGNVPPLKTFLIGVKLGL